MCPVPKLMESMQRDLVIKARGGDHDAFSQLVTAAHPRLFNVARLILRDADRAGDAVQDALIQAWRHIRALRDPDAWDAWIHRTTVHACYRVARKEKRRSMVEMHVDVDPAQGSAADTIERIADRDRLERELDRLDLDRRAVIVLHYYLDLPLTEVAEILDIPAGTAKSRLNRGLADMRTSMQVVSPTLGAPTVERSA